jgi:2-oxoglutarate dehydrogenase E2 component (dihydrolipoamide succinyltransferase)
VAPPVAVIVTADAPVPPPAPVLQRADPEAIAKARDAVRQKIEENPTTPPVVIVPQPVAATPAAAAVPAPVPAPASAASFQATVSAPPVAAPAPLATQPADSDAIAKAREAVRQAITEDVGPGPTADPGAIAKAREAVRQRTESINYADAASSAGNSTAFNFPPLEGPPLPISSEKQQQLRELLQRYKADQVTPEQYQTERAKILAAP